jgi:hypothetical protein
MPRHRLTRRQLGLAALAAAAPAAAAQDEKPKPPSAADALLEIVKLRYGKQLDEAKLKAVRGNLQRDLATAEKLHKLEVADEPAFAFSAELP